MQQIGISVFGSSEPEPGEPLFEKARALGRLLAEAGFCVVTGGYGGVMEGASRGAREAGGETLGITCELFQQRPPNAYLSRRISTPDLHDRTRLIIERSRGYVVLDGKAGTLAELAFVWALHRSGCLGSRPVILLDALWNDLVEGLRPMLEGRALEMTHLAKTPEAALEVIRRHLPQTEAE